MQILLINKLKQEMKMKNKKRILIAVIIIIVLFPILIISHRINSKNKLHEARKEIDKIANQDNVNDENIQSDEIVLLFNNIYMRIDVTINKIEKENTGITGETSDTLFTAIKDNLHFVELLSSERDRHSILDKNWQDSIEIILSQEKTKTGYIKMLNEIKNDIKELQKTYN